VQSFLHLLHYPSGRGPSPPGGHRPGPRLRAARRLDRWRPDRLAGCSKKTSPTQKKPDEQRIAKQLYDTARLPQPFHGVLSSDVLPAEGLTRLTIDTR